MTKTQKSGFIYLITNKIDKRCYVGQTIMKNAKDRFTVHKRDLKNRRHNPKLQHFVDKYGINQLELHVLASNIYGENLLDDLERYYIKFYDSYENGFNCTPGGDQPYNYKREISIKNIKENKVYIFESLEEAANYIKVHPTTFYQLFSKEQDIIKKEWCRIDFEPVFHEFINSDGEIFKVLNGSIGEFSKKHNIPRGTLGKLVCGAQLEAIGWRLLCNRNATKYQLNHFKLINNSGLEREFFNIKDCVKKLPIGWGNKNCYLYDLLSGRIQEFKGWKILQIIKLESQKV